MYGILTVKPVKVNLKCLTLCSNSLRSYGKNNTSNRMFGSVFNDNKSYHKKGSFTVGLNMYNIGVIRPHFSSTNEDISSVLKKTKPKKRRQYNSKKTTNITEVTELSSTQRNTTLPKLKSHELRAFIASPYPGIINSVKQSQFNRNEERPIIVSTELTYKCWDNPKFMAQVLASFHSFKNLNENDKCENEENAEIKTDIDQNKCAVVAQDIPKSQMKTEAKSTTEAKQFSKQLSLARSLNTFLNMCVLNNSTGRGWSILLNYRSSCKLSKMKRNITDIELYNILLSSYASKGNRRKIVEICKVLDEDSIPYRPQTYAAIFECLGRMPTTTENRSLLLKYKEEAESKEITMNRIMDESLFVRDQREVVLNAIRRVDLSFQPVYTPPDLFYSNRLLESLNKNIRPIEIIDSATDTKPVRNTSDRGESLRDAIKKQMDLELDGRLTIPSIVENSASTDNVEFYRKKLDELYGQWRVKIHDSIVRDLNSIKHKINANGHSVNIQPYLGALSVDEYVSLLLSEIRYLADSSETYTPTTAQLYSHLAKRVLLRYQILLKQQNGIIQKTSKVYEEYCDLLLSDDKTDNPRQIWQRLDYHHLQNGPSLNIADQNWSWPVISAIGKFLYNILLKDLKIDLNLYNQSDKIHPVPVFYTLLRYRDKFVKEEVKAHPVFMKLHKRSNPQTLTFDANLVPMLCPPVPWTTPNNGAYLITHSDLIRLPSQAIKQLERIKKINPPSQLYPALDSLNQLASIPWKVNTEVLDVIIKVFNDGGSVKLDVPQPPSALENIVEEEVAQDMEKTEKSKLYSKNYHEKMLFRRRQAEMYGLWCDVLYRLSLANYFRDKTFWLPHNMDFRGRVYPIPPHLNHLGSDLSRCLLVFHQARPLGKDGFRWLKLHCINLTGLKKKSSIAERLAFADEIMEDILDSADHPLTGRMWWSTSDEPWQTLACCMEIAHVSRCPDPAAFMSHFPIHQDGSCNGLQHYAALGRDQIGAVSVNLASSDRPQDVYSAVAAKVEAARELDASNGLEIAQILEGFVVRKVIKQTVMTTVYGVTQYGARLQIERQLKYIEAFPQEHVSQASSYLTKKTFESLRAMFTSAKEIQDWFTQCARLISTVRVQPVEWVTPLGLPVVQPYIHQKKGFSVRPIQSVETNTTDMHDRPNTVKQKNAFPPNFIHSLDSSHMMLTSINCEKAGFTFISVHDCFWTHACTVSDMNKICREQFVLLHSQPILEDLSRFFSTNYGYSEEKLSSNSSDVTKKVLNRTLQQLPKKGEFNLENVLDSVYFFS